MKAWLYIACSTNCKECEGSINDCISCQDSQPFLYGSSCHDSCPSGSYESSSNTCESCSSNCQECEGNSQNCTSCSEPNPLLYESRCISGCPNGTYQSSLNTCEGIYYDIFD